MKKLLALLRENSLVQNSFYPMLSTAIMAGLGFLFWMFVARLFTESEVGLAATLISVMSTVSVFSLLGFDTATIRFFSHEKNKNKSINTGFAILSLAAFVLSSLFVIHIERISPGLAYLFENSTLSILFVLFTILSTINGYTDAIFLAYRKTKYTLIINTIFSVCKAAFPFLFVSYGVFGIFAAAALAQSVGFVLSIIVLVKYFSYKPALTIDSNIIAKVWKYSAGNYIADIFTFLPTAILPIIITNNIGAEETAYYYIVLMVVGLLYVIPASTMRALFAESSHDAHNISKNICTALKTTFFFLTPAILILLLLGNHLLTSFGAQYAEKGITLLYILTLSGILVTISTLYASLFRLTGATRLLIARNAIFTFTLIGGTYLFLPHGLVGVGVSYICAHILSILFCVLFYKKGVLQHMQTCNNE